LCDIVRQAATDVVGQERVIDMPPIMGAEDFSRFGRKVPSMFFSVGVRNDERGLTWPHHHPRFDIDEAGMAPGMETMARSVLAYLQRGVG
jgi:amidohydrolase